MAEKREESYYQLLCILFPQKVAKSGHILFAEYILPIIKLLFQSTSKKLLAIGEYELCSST